MRFTRDGVWTISTPVYVGSVEDVIEAERCPHEEWVWFSKDVKERTLMIAERCAHCIATRVRYRTLANGENPEVSS